MLGASTPIFRDGFSCGLHPCKSVQELGYQGMEHSYHQVVCDVLPISNWKNMLRISILFFLCGRIRGLLTTEGVAQLGPFSMWTQQAAVSGSVLPSCALPEHGNSFSSDPNKGEAWCRPFVTPSERDFGSSAAVGCKAQRTPCAVVSAFPLGSDCAVPSCLRETSIFLAPWNRCPSLWRYPNAHRQLFTFPLTHRHVCSAVLFVISRGGLSDFQTHWSRGVLCASWLHLKYRSAPSYSSFSPVALVAGVIQLLRILQQLSVFFKFPFARVWYWKVCVI